MEWTKLPKLRNSSKRIQTRVFWTESAMLQALCYSAHLPLRWVTLEMRAVASNSAGTASSRAAGKQDIHRVIMPNKTYTGSSRQTRHTLGHHVKQDIHWVITPNKTYTGSSRQTRHTRGHHPKQDIHWVISPNKTYTGSSRQTRHTLGHHAKQDIHWVISPNKTYTGSSRQTRHTLGHHAKNTKTPGFVWCLMKASVDNHSNNIIVIDWMRKHGVGVFHRL